MDPEIVKAAADLKQIAAIIVGGVPAGEFIKAAVLPTANLLGERMKHRIERCFDGAARKLQAANFRVQAVPEKILLPLLQGVALEEDEGIHKMWENLLTNAASPDNAKCVGNWQITILKEMSPLAAKLLNGLFDETTSEGQWPHNFFLIKEGTNLASFIPKSYPNALETMISLESLQTVSLISAKPETDIDIRQSNALAFGPNIALSECYRLTLRGVEFVRACRPPKAKDA